MPSDPALEAMLDEFDAGITKAERELHRASGEQPASVVQAHSTRAIAEILVVVARLGSALARDELANNE